MYFCRNLSSEAGQSEETVIFFDNEIHLLESSMTVPDNNFEDFQAQALHAAVYMLWLTKVSIGLLLSRQTQRLIFRLIEIELSFFLLCCFPAKSSDDSFDFLFYEQHIPELWRMLEEKLGTEKLKCLLNTVDQERPSLVLHQIDTFAAKHNNDY